MGVISAYGMNICKITSLLQVNIEETNAKRDKRADPLQSLVFAWARYECESIVQVQPHLKTQVQLGHMVTGGQMWGSVGSL